MKKLLIWLTNTKAYYFLIMRIMPYIRFSVYYTDMKGHQYNKAYDQLQPGMFMLSLDSRKATAMLVPGFMTHASYCIAKKRDNPYAIYEVAEMTHHNFTMSDAFDIFKEADRVIICDCDDWTAEDKSQIISIVVSKFKKALYDISFSFGIKMLYCSEMVYQGDLIGPKKLKVDLTDIHGLGRKYISPDGLLFGKNVRIIHDTAGELNGLTGPEAEKVCKALGYIK